MRFPHPIAFVACFTLGCSLAGFAAAETAESLRAKATAVLAQLEGEIVVPGLTAPVEVLRDRWGVPHIYAQNQADLFLAQGFVVAQDRLFQLDLWKRVNRGETAAIVGEKGLAADRFARLMKYRGDPEAEWQSYSPDAKEIAKSFTMGINMAITQMFMQKRMPIEFQILKYQPAYWQPEDILSRMSGLIMVGNYDDEIDRTALIAAIGVEAARRIVPTDPVRPFAPVPELDLSGITSELLKGYEAATAPLPVYIPEETGPNRGGSNNWAVTGRRSASGKPLLAGDPHRALLLPSLRYLVHLNAPGWNVIGAGEPALPGVAIGHNERVAWAFTIVNTDQADLYVEEMNPNDPTQYKVGAEWKTFRYVREQVAVRGKQPVEVELKYTRHGPVIHEDREKHKAYVLRWVGSEPGAAAYLASLRLDRVKSAAEFIDQLPNWKVPALNMVFADVDGDIGWVASGATPIRQGWDGLLPVPGAAGKYEWQGFLPVGELPQKYNPKEGFVASANYNILPPDYKHTISYEWAAPYRIRQIEKRLAAKETFTLDDFRSIQHDATSIPAQTLIRLLNDVVQHPIETKAAPPDADCAKLFLEWDGVLSKDSRAAVLYGYWLNELVNAYYQPLVPEKNLAFARSRGGVPTMFADLERRWSVPPITSATYPPRTDPALLFDTFNAAVKKAKTRFPKYPAEGTWGELHGAGFTHPLARLGPAYAEAFSLAPVPKPGDGYTPNAASHDAKFNQTHGASYREVFDLADWDRGLATSTPGQSGQPGSPYYGDLQKLWGDEEYFPLAYSRAKVEEVTAHRLLLKPGPVQPLPPAPR